MLPKLFELNNGVIIPTEHCYTISFLRDIMDAFPDNYLKIYAFIFYMSCPNADMNPFINIKESDKEDLIYTHIDGDFSLEDPMIMNSLDEAKKLYETPAYRAYLGIKVMLDNLSEYLKTPITAGRDGNGDFLLKAAERYTKIKDSYHKAYEDLKVEQMKVRGNRNLGYDQRGKNLKEDELFDNGIPDE